MTGHPSKRPFIQINPLQAGAEAEVVEDGGLRPKPLDEFHALAL